MTRLTLLRPNTFHRTNASACARAGEHSAEKPHLHTQKKESTRGYVVLFSISLLFIAFGFANGTLPSILAGFSRIISSTNILITDYVALGGIGAAFVNAGLLMLAAVALLVFLRAPFRGITFAAVFLMGSFGLFGKNVYNVWPILFGTWLYARLKKEALTENVYTALFATCLSPIVTEFAFVPHLPQKMGALLGILVGICAGLAAPPLAGHLKNVHKGFSLYNLGFTAGIIGTVFVSLLKSYGYQTGFNLIWSNTNNALFGVFLSLLFALFVVLGFWIKPYAFEGVKAIFRESGQAPADFVAVGGLGAALVNMGLNGLIATGYVLLVGGPLNGPTIGGILTISGFGACGKHGKNVLPVLLGVVIGSLTKVWNIDDPAVLLAALFGTSLAPIAGHYGWVWGIVAGFLNSSVALCSGVLHGGMNLYNTGFSAGIVAAFLVPLLEALPKQAKRRVPIPARPAPESLAEN